MLIANQKRKENIAEYLLYMFQIEDLIRAYSFDVDLLEVNIISKFEQPYHVKRDMREWYLSIIAMMKEENIIEKGHLQFIQNSLNDLNDLHIRMIKFPEEVDYQKNYVLAKPGIDDLIQKSTNPTINEIEACFNGLYGLLIFRMKNKTISPETAQAMQYISKLIAELSKKYKQIENGEVEL